MTYQSLNPATGKLLKKFVELTDKRPPAVRTQMAGVSSPVSGYPLRPLNSDFESTITALSNRTANSAILESIIGPPQAANFSHLGKKATVDLDAKYF